MIVFSGMLAIAMAVAVIRVPWRQEALSGELGRRMGLVSWYFCIAVFLLLRKIGGTKEKIKYVFAAGAGIAAFIGNLNFLGSDPLNMYRNLVRNQHRTFIGTIGNVNAYAGFMCLAVPVLLALFYRAKNRRDRILFGALSVIVIYAGFTSGCDSFLAGCFGMGVVFLYVSMGDPSGMRSFWNLCVLFFLSVLIFTCTLVFGQGTKSVFILRYGKKGFVKAVTEPRALLAAGIVLTVLILFEMKVLSKKPDLYPRIRKRLFGAAAVAAVVFAVLVVVVNMIAISAGAGGDTAAGAAVSAGRNGADTDAGGNGADTDADAGGNGADTDADAGGNGADTDAGRNGADTDADAGRNGADTDAGRNGADTDADAGGNGADLDATDLPDRDTHPANPIYKGAKNAESVTEPESKIGAEGVTEPESIVESGTETGSESGGMKEAGGGLGPLLHRLVLKDSFGSSRGYIWKYTVRTFDRLPLLYKLFGVGPDCFYYAVYAFYGQEMNDRFNSTVTDAHCDFFQMLITTGIVGTAGYFGILITCLVSCVAYAAGDCRGSGIPIGADSIETCIFQRNDKAFERRNTQNLCTAIGADEFRKGDTDIETGNPWKNEYALAVTAMIASYLCQGIANNAQIAVTPVFFVLLGLMTARRGLSL